MSDVNLGQGAVVQAAPSTNAGSIQIVVKRSDHHIEIDMDKLTWKDAKALNKYRAAMADGTMTEEEATAVMDGLIEKVAGRHPDDMPMEVVNKIVETLFGADAGAVDTQGN